MDPNLQGMKQGHPFLITGLGASGTRWLAKHLDSSLNWRVQHEPANSYYITPKVFTGSVDSTVRHTVVVDDYLQEGRLAVVIRDPRDIAEHCVAKGTWRRVKHEISRDVARLQDLLEQGARPIYFSDFGNRTILASVERWAGIHDIPKSHTVPRIGHAKRGGPARSVRVAARNLLCDRRGIMDYIDKWVEAR